MFQVSLRDSLAQLARGEAVSATAKSSQPLRGNSPRGTSNTLVTPTSPKLPSPHSPRRPLHVKKQNVGVVENQKVGNYFFKKCYVHVVFFFLLTM